MGLDFSKNYIEILLAVGTAWISSLVAVYKFGVHKTKKNKKAEALQKRYELIYSPLRTILLDSHITSCQAMLYPKLSQRLRRAWNLSKDFGIGTGLKACIDKYGTKPSAEIEFGGFSIREMKNIISKNSQWADSRLLSHIQWAERSRYESFQRANSYLTDEEVELIDYIFDTYEKLNNRLIPE